jgi:hypothetical protein
MRPAGYGFPRRPLIGISVNNGTLSSYLITNRSVDPQINLLADVAFEASLYHPPPDSKNQGASGA